MSGRPAQVDTRIPPAFSGIVTRNPDMLGIFSYLTAIAASREPLLIQGESGTGKELVVRAVHRLSASDQPLIAVNIAGLDDQVFSDTLFGHVKGAYTGADRARKGMIEQAAGGILFLDEIGDLSLSSQIKLLRLLQEGEYYPLGSDRPSTSRARILVATNAPLVEKERGGNFRRDLLYRLQSHHIELPPLRERKEDLPLLLDYFLAEAATVMGKQKPTIPAQLPALLATYSFPGNIRELRAMTCDAVSVHKGGVLSMARFKKAINGNTPKPADKAHQDRAAAENPFFFPETLPTLKQANHLLIKEALRRSQGNQSLAAQLLGISHQALSQRLKK